MRGVYVIARADRNTQDRHCVVGVMSVLPGTGTGTCSECSSECSSFNRARARIFMKASRVGADSLCEALPS